MRANMVDQDTMKEIVRRIVEVAKPDRIILFGSRARGDASSGSDVDLLVVKSNVRSRREIADQIYVKLIGVPVPIDVLVLTPDDIVKYAEAAGITWAIKRFDAASSSVTVRYLPERKDLALPLSEFKARLGVKKPA